MERQLLFSGRVTQHHKATVGMNDSVSPQLRRATCPTQPELDRLKFTGKINMTQNPNTIFKNNDTFNYKLKKKTFAETMSKSKTDAKLIENICNISVSLLDI